LNRIAVICSALNLGFSAMKIKIWFTQIFIVFSHSERVITISLAFSRDLLFVFAKSERGFKIYGN
jgi:hypothetical protein